MDWRGAAVLVAGFILLGDSWFQLLIAAFSVASSVGLLKELGIVYATVESAHCPP